MKDHPIQAIVIMGVSGSGKSTVGPLLAERLGGPFLDADDFHPAENIAKMRSGIALTDADREPWLQSLRARIAAHPLEAPPLVLACSALKRAYRDSLRGSDGATAFIHLHGSRDQLAERLARRAAESDHFMPGSLLDSQLDALEPPEHEALTWQLAITDTPETLANLALSHLRHGVPRG
ncbi:gluconokinase [Haloferula rosea]|uniref:Gluconokinase n=1 Tax=Haloferula rosea TaxID=490093 RepID=A0A934VHB1_9BACT|nr:gluconokinase [Haloferula rosea]MBK1828470.1 gluconokinase [Haloferula rosea]